MSRIITEKEFNDRLEDTFIENDYELVTGPGRSGAITAVYVSHKFGIPFLPYKQIVVGKKIIVVDTTINTGRTLRKASKFYNNSDKYYVFGNQERYYFWYENITK